MSFKDAEKGSDSLFYKYPLKYVPILVDVLVDECLYIQSQTNICIWT